VISTPIYKRDSVGNIRVWQYEVEGDRWRSFAGILDGALVESGWTVCTPKSRPTPEEQALFEAQAEEKKKLERDYHRSIDTIDTPLFFKPMLAKAYEAVTFDRRVSSQPKLDGIRCIATAKGLFSRQGKRFLACPHVEEALEPLFAADPNLVLDGELYNHDLKADFNAITSAVRKQKPSDLDIEQSRSLIQYHVYDLPIPATPFTKRWAELAEIIDPVLGSTIKLVDTVLDVDQIALDLLNVQYAEEGYEGQMVRLDAAYEQKRSKHLLKRKEFQDAEFRVIGVEEGLGNWAGYAKRLVLTLPDGREFGAGVKGNQDFTRQLLADRERFIGGEATIRFFAYTPDGIPRFPVAVDFHPEGRAD
jgi:DNA ligase-1